MDREREIVKIDRESERMQERDIIKESKRIRPKERKRKF